MKVLAVAGTKYMVEMDGTELERLTGRSTWGDAEQENIGCVLKIRDSWDTIRSLQVGQKDLPQIANKLRALADLLEPIAVEIPVTQEPVK